MASWRIKLVKVYVGNSNIFEFLCFIMAKRYKLQTDNIIYLTINVTTNNVKMSLFWKKSNNLILKLSGGCKNVKMKKKKTLLTIYKMCMVILDKICETNSHLVSLKFYGLLHNRTYISTLLLEEKSLFVFFIRQDPLIPFNGCKGPHSRRL
jgi:ribosomal protein S11